MFGEHLQLVLIVAVEHNVFPMSASLCFPIVLKQQQQQMFALAVT